MQELIIIYQYRALKFIQVKDFTMLLKFIFQIYFICNSLLIRPETEIWENRTSDLYTIAIIWTICLCLSLIIDNWFIYLLLEGILSKLKNGRVWIWRYIAINIWDEDFLEISDYASARAYSIKSWVLNNDVTSEIIQLYKTIEVLKIIMKSTILEKWIKLLLP